MTIYHDKNDNGDIMHIDAAERFVWINISNRHGSESTTLTRDEAIAAARAILAHYKEPV